ncbi:MAG: hypothetical protein JNL54_07760 [Kineosporiaceae bacterium]|nr:hypothetical protein [Kineosporiaceae bacterium]
MTSTRSARTTRRIALVATSLTLALTGAGCSSSTAGAAAVVDGRRISVAEVQQATTDIAAYTGQEVAPSQVLFFLIVGPQLVKAAAANGVGISDAEARQELTTKVAEPSDAAIAAIRANESLQQLNGLGEAQGKPAVDAIVAQLKQSDIEVSPRYGRFDTTTVSVVPVEQNWLVPSGKASS